MRKTLLAAALATTLTAPAWAESQRGVTPNEIVIGTYTDLSGVTAMWGLNNSNSYRMVFSDTNAKGGIDGRKIKYIVEDNQYQVPRSVQAANKLINRDGVFIMVANGGTPMNNAVMPDQIAKGVANVFPLTSARSMYEPFNKYKFALGSSYYDQIRSGVKYFVEQRGKKKVCSMSQDTDFGRDVSQGVTDQLKAMNLKLAGETLHKPTDTDFSASVARMRDANCDLVVIGGIVRDTVQIISAITKTGWKVDMLGQAASYDEAVAEMPGGASEGFYSMAP
ncbi:MAG: ABC transporter substrate-binding protein, partial [Rhodospirillales bacterium]|nr:ABC transporter substrate-binding protein [Rhodospirillales bacterium]